MARDAVTGDRQRNRIFRASFANIIQTGYFWSDPCRSLNVRSRSKGGIGRRRDHVGSFLERGYQGRRRRPKINAPAA
jgi:hypothetical protein